MEISAAVAEPLSPFYNLFNDHGKSDRRRKGVFGGRGDHLTAAMTTPELVTIPSVSGLFTNVCIR